MAEMFYGMLNENGNPLRELKELGANVDTMLEMSGVLAPINALGVGPMNQDTNLSRIAPIDEEFADDYVEPYGDVDPDTDILGDDDTSLNFKGFDDEDEEFYEFGESDDMGDMGMMDDVDDESFSVEDVAGELADDDDFLSLLDAGASDEELIGFIADEFGLDVMSAEDAYDIAMDMLEEPVGDVTDSDGEFGDEYSYGESVEDGDDMGRFDSDDLIDRIDSAIENENTETESKFDISCRLIADIAELMAKRYDAIGESEIADSLIDVANATDTLSESEADHESLRRILRKRLHAVTEAVREYETKVGF